MNFMIWLLSVTALIMLASANDNSDKTCGAKPGCRTPGYEMCSGKGESYVSLHMDISARF